jgi:hypothetical protein
VRIRSVRRCTLGHGDAGQSSLPALALTCPVITSGRLAHVSSATTEVHAALPGRQDHLETSLARAAEADPLGNGVLRWVEKDFRAYLRCGILAHGFARARCQDCGHERLIPSCLHWLRLGYPIYGRSGLGQRYPEDANSAGAIHQHL